MTKHTPFRRDGTRRLALRPIGVLFLALAMAASTTHPQVMSMFRDDSDERPSFLFYEPVNLIGDDSSVSRLDMPYRIDQSFFVPVKNRDTSSHWSFISHGEILIELFDSLDISKARSLQNVEIGTDRPDREQPGKKWYKGLASFEVPPGSYKIVFEIDDLESDRRYIDDRSTIRLKRFAPHSSELSTPLFVKWGTEPPPADTLEPVDFGPHLLFGEKAALFVEVPYTDNTASDIHAEYSIAVAAADRPAVIALAETVATPRVLTRVRLERIRYDNTAEYAVQSRDSSYATGLIIPLASEKLPLRRFDMSLTVKQGATVSKTVKTFQMVWPDMPFSLRDIDYAINALKYISTEDLRDSLHGGSLDERRDKLEAFWRRKDNTPGTAYNEVMVEYYRRVDHASKTFGTLHDPDGFKSDRGRIYILYGPPTKTDRTLSPSAGYQEVWTYEKLAKKFIFEDQTKSGNYVLISTEPL